MDRKRWAFPLVGVAAARSGGETRVALAGVAPIPWLLEGSLDDATPLPKNAYKVEVAKALVKRARSALAAWGTCRCSPGSRSWPAAGRSLPGRRRRPRRRPAAA